MKTLDDSKKKEIVKFSKEIGVDNPLKCTDLELLQKLFSFAKEL
jgi:hypothetical protein